MLKTFTSISLTHVGSYCGALSVMSHPLNRKNGISYNETPTGGGGGGGGA